MGYIYTTLYAINNIQYTTDRSTETGRPADRQTSRPADRARNEEVSRAPEMKLGKRLLHLRIGAGRAVATLAQFSKPMTEKSFKG